MGCSICFRSCKNGSIIMLRIVVYSVGFFNFRANEAQTDRGSQVEEREKLRRAEGGGGQNVRKFHKFLSY